MGEGFCNQNTSASNTNIYKNLESNSRNMLFSYFFQSISPVQLNSTSISNTNFSSVMFLALSTLPNLTNNLHFFLYVLQSCNWYFSSDSIQWGWLFICLLSKENTLANIKPVTIDIYWIIFYSSFFLHSFLKSHRTLSVWIITFVCFIEFYRCNLVNQRDMIMTSMIIVVTNELVFVNCLDCFD